MKYTDPHRFKRAVLAFLLAGIFLADTALAGAPILPDKNAPGERMPLVEETASGIPLVHIAAPSSGGVSRNDYEKFNVPEKGAILNNSYTLSKTELAGYVQGNANMGRGPAKIIVNQVISGNPTMMEGFLEVAGNKADVIIANPNGITVNGGGFINTSRTVLTTGKPEYDREERIKDFRIDNDATILITGNGLNGKKADTLELYTRAAAVQTAIWGNTVNITTGANIIDYETGKASAIEGGGKRPDIAIDVKDLGGMYAGRIFLIGNERGLPMDIRGTIESSHLVLDNEGNLYHRGTMHTKEDMDIHSQDIQNTGVMASSGNMSIKADRSITNEKIIGSTGNMGLTARTIKNSRTIASEKDLSITTSSMGENALDNRESEILANGNMSIETGHLNNTKGNMASGNSLSIQGNTVDNRHGKMTAYKNMTASVTDTLDNREGEIAANEDISLSSDEIHNTKGTIAAGNDEIMVTKNIQLDGKLSAGNHLSITTEGDITNDNAEEGYGITQAGGNLTLTTKGNLTNGRKLEAKGILNIQAKDITNREKGELNGGDMAITSGSLSNHGLITADRKNEITADNLQNISTGRIYGEDISINVKIIENRKDKELEEQLSLAVQELRKKEKELDDAFAADVTAFTTETEKENYFKTIEEKDKAYMADKEAADTVIAAMNKIPSPTIASRNDMTITGNSLLNTSSSMIYAGGNLSISETGSITNRGGDIKAMGDLSLSAKDIRNENEAFSAKRVWIDHVTNPKLIRIDQNGHPERGKAFEESEFSSLSSGYGAYHDKGIQPKELLEEAGYDKIEQISDEEREEGDTPVPPELIGKEAPNYEYDDPIFKEMNVQSMDSPRPAYDDPKQAEWDRQYKEILVQLNEKIKEYNREAKAYNDSIGAIEGKAIHNYTIIRTHTHTSEKQVQETRAGTISSGKDMTLTGNVTNENSRITAGAALQAKGGTLENKADRNQIQKITFGTTQESYTKRKPRPHKARRRRYRREIFMTPQKEMENPTSLDVGTYEGMTGKKPSREDMTETIRDNVEKNLNPFDAGKERQPGTSAGKETGGILSFIPENSLYKLHPEETATYLVETDPAFTNKKKFLSSDYMYEHLLWDHDKVTKRLGDGFYEQEIIRNQITGLTGMRYLEGFTNDEEQYKALMDAGIAYAKEYNLKPGIALTKEQMAALTSDIVWLEKTEVTLNGKTWEVLYPHVYLKSGSPKVLTEEGSIISANTLIADTEENLKNEGVLKGNTILVTSENIVNTGALFGKTISMKAGNDILHHGIIEGEDKVLLDAGRNISMKDNIIHGKNQDILSTTAGIAVKGKDGLLLMQAGNDISLTGAALSALGEKGSVILSAGHDLTMDTDTLISRKDMTENRDNYIRTYRKTETGNTITAGKDIALISGNNIKARNTTAVSKNGAVTLNAGEDITIENGYNEAIDDYGLKYKERGFLSSKTTTIKSHDESKTVSGSIISGDSVSIISGGNTRVIASTVAGTNDVSILSGKDTVITSAEETERHDYDKQVKKSGLLSGGLGFTIGKEKRKDQYDGRDILQKGSTIGSVKGSVTIASHENVDVEASDILAGKDISITGENVTISSKDNIYTSDEKHEYKKSGLTVSLGGGTVDAIHAVSSPANRMTEVSDNRLKALYGYETVSKFKENKAALKKAAKGDVDLAVSIGIGSSSSKSESHSKITEVKGSMIQSGENVKIRTEENINVKGSDISGNNITLESGKDIHISAAEETMTEKTSQKNKGGSIGVNLSAGSVVSVTGSLYAGKEKENSSITSYKESTVYADDILTMKSGKDTRLIGSTADGNKVEAEIGGNLAVESLQTRKEYSEENRSAGISFGRASGKTSYSGSASKGSLKSDYESVTEQAGIQAGDEGFAITVKDNTHLKGGVIDSKAEKEKNALTTGTLSWEDVKNKAEYKGSGAGISFNTAKNAKYNERGVTPAISTGSKEKASSVTKSAVSKGTIAITDKEKQKQDITSLNRDTKNSLNQLSEIFDKTKVEERQELAGLFGKIAFNHLHDAKLTPNQRSAWHALIGGVMGELSNKDFLGGATAAGINEMLIRHMEKASNGNPATMQWMSAAIGGITGELISKNPQLGAATASSGTKNNDELDEEMAAANGKNAEEIRNIQIKNLVDTGIFDDINPEMMESLLKIYQEKLPEKEKKWIESKIKSTLLEGVTIESLTILGKEAKAAAPLLSREIDMKMQGIAAISSARGTYNTLTVAIAIYVYILNKRYEERPITREDFKEWLKQSMVD